jgi:hypothetical protein
MISLEKLVEIGFTLTQATDISVFLRNIGYLTVGTTCLKEPNNLPANKTLVIDTNDTLNSLLNADSQEYMDISILLTQKGNMKPNKARVNNVILYCADKQESEDYGNLVDEFVSVNANWSQLLINSTKDEDIKAAAAKALTNNRLFVAQCNSDAIAQKTEENIALALAALENSNTMLVYHTTANESLAAGIASIMAQPYLGAVGSLYSTVTSVTPEDYTALVNTNLEEQNVSFYTYVNAINGGGVSQYATPILYGGYMINGEDAKRRYIRYCLDLLLKVKSIDFLKKKLGYEDSSADVLLSMLKSVLKAGQTNGLIKKDSIVTSGENTIETKGFEVKAIYPSELRDLDESLYNKQTYKIQGYYADSLTGRKVEIDLLIDPTDAEKTDFGF